MSGRASSKRWYKKQINDPFVKRREQAGYRSRAAFKLLELIESDRLCRAGSVILDLGATPGGWSQVVAPLVGASGKVIAVDLLPMEALTGVTFIRGDAMEQVTTDQIRAELQARQVDLVLCDMAPNLTGIRSVDEARTLVLAGQALQITATFLRRDGTLVMKLFQHADTEVFIREVKQHFRQIARRKPGASRTQSREFYLVASGFQL
ncbi:MAG: RlmE family RNA methyltransferase [Gammaproteobacteria bacterium]|nr:RlmE family RNA methyltransferase [Gammaproteobacteria bacterium]